MGNHRGGECHHVGIFGTACANSAFPSWIREVFIGRNLSRHDPVLGGHEDARPRRLEITSDGIVWYVDYVDGMLGRLDPKTGEIDEWNVPGGSGSRPYAMASDAKDRIWFVESGRDPNRFVGFDPRTSSFTSSVDIESGGGTVRHMHYRAATNEVWFGTDTNYIGRARLPE